ncbi:hypothetical protein OTK49_03545 [Vibrio coralliirubri]|uniref:hypothetical protein n=1 Tax=Vibrio coralliirubri TaxID=1516159 RepID=UPI002283B5F5|nr:hypothetical protein [Vibrio coralliirubri]MCY9861592.1 hypothetical protein [Vibrio coralliirubri]
MSNVVFSIQRGVIICHNFERKLASGYRLKDGTLLKGEKPEKRVGFDSLDIITLTEDAQEAIKYSKAEVSRMYDIMQVAGAAQSDVEFWVNNPEFGSPKSRIV